MKKAGPSRRKTRPVFTRPALASRIEQRSGRGRSSGSNRGLGRDALGDHAGTGAAATDAATVATGTATIGTTATDAAAVRATATDAAGVSTAAGARGRGAAPIPTMTDRAGAAAPLRGGAARRSTAGRLGSGTSGLGSGAGRAGVAAARARSTAARLTAAAAETAGGRGRVGDGKADDEGENHRKNRGETLHGNLQERNRTHARPWSRHELNTDPGRLPDRSTRNVEISRPPPPERPGASAGGTM